MIEQRAAPTAIEGLETRTVGHEVLVHDPVHKKIHVLNQTAAAVLAMCDGTRQPAKIAAALAASTGAPAELVRADVEKMVAVFRRLALVH